MPKLERVLACCTEGWEEHRTIASRYDEKYPLRWWNFMRRLCRWSSPTYPTVIIYSELYTLEQRGVLEFKQEGFRPARKGERPTRRQWYRLRASGSPANSVPTN